VTTWHATIEWTADHVPDATGAADQLVDALADYHVGVVMVPDELGRWSTTIAVEANTIRQATDEALSVISTAARNIGQRRVNVVALDVVDADGFKHRLEQPTIPELVGYAGASKIAGEVSGKPITPQRARQIARDDPRHPRHATDIEGYGPVYLGSALRAYYATRNPKPGRPPKETTAP
jgi:hypothetical protein